MTILPGIQKTFTKAQIAAFLGRSPASVSKSLEGIPAPTTITLNHKQVPAWPLEILPRHIRSGVGEALKRMASGIGFAPDPFVSQTAEPRLRYRNRKKRADAKLGNLPEADKERLHAWLNEENLTCRECADRILATWGLKVSESSISNFFASYCSPRLLQKRPPPILASIRIDFGKDGARVAIIGPASDQFTKSP